MRLVLSLRMKACRATRDRAASQWGGTFGLPKGSNVVPFGQHIIIPQKKMGHIKKGTTLEPLV